MHSHIIHGPRMNLKAVDVLAHVKIIGQMTVAADVFRADSDKGS